MYPASKPRSNMESDDVQVLPNATLDAARAAREEKLLQFEARRVARTLIVPTDDIDVRLALRARRQPVCYFGEDAHDRRERLRAAMAKETMDAGARASSVDVDDAVAARNVDQHASQPQMHVEQEEYYTEGAQQLKELRLALAKPSLLRARRRLEEERLLAAITDVSHPKRKTIRDAETEVVEAVRAGNIVSSQIVEGRPLSAISTGVHPTDGTSVVVTGSWSGEVNVWKGDFEFSNIQTIGIHSERISNVYLPREYSDVLLTSSADNTAALFKCGSEGEKMFQLEHRFEGHKARVSDAKIHPFRKSLVATCSFDGCVILHDNGRSLLHQQTGHKQVYRVCFHPDGGLMGSCGLDGGIRLWDLRSGKAVKTMSKAHADDVLGMECSGDGRVLASCSKDNLVKIWDLRTGRCAKTIAAHRALISGLRFGGGASCSDVLYTSSFDRSVKIWSARRNWGLLALHSTHEDKVTAVDCSADGKRVVSAGYDKTWKLEVLNSLLAPDLIPPRGKEPRAVAWLQTGGKELPIFLSKTVIFSHDMRIVQSKKHVQPHSWASTPEMDYIAELRTMWQFAATWKVLKLLSRPLSFTMPGPAELEAALLNPLENLSVMAILHGRLLGLSANASSAKKWLQTAARFVRNRPDDFEHLLAKDTNTTTADNAHSDRAINTDSPNQDRQLPDTVQAPNEVSIDLHKPAVFPAVEDAYAQLSPVSRLLFLHTISEIVLSEHDSLLSAGNLLDFELHELRLDPIGRDAAGNSYWYFGDLERIYREPFRRPEKSKQEVAEARRQQQRKEAALKARLAKEAKRAENQIKKEEQRLRREERKRKAMAKWAPRVAASRTTRASRRAEQSLLVGPAAPTATTSEQQSVDSGVAQTPRGGRSRMKNSSASTVNSDEAKVDGENQRSTSRSRKISSQEASTASTASRPAKRPRKTGPDFADITLRQCNGWQVLTTDANSLFALLDRFGPPADAPNAAERALLKYLHAEILPAIQEAEQKVRREREKREKTEFLLTNQKRSSRVAALEERREEEARRLAAQEEEERLEEEKKEKHSVWVQKKLNVLELEQSRDIRVTRHRFNLMNEIERDERAHKLQTAQKARFVPSTRPRRVSRRTRRFEDPASPETTEHDRGIDEDWKDDHASTPSSDRMGSNSAEDSDKATPVLDAADHMEIEMEKSVSAENAHTEASSLAANQEVQESDSKPFLSGIDELSVEASFTWLDNADDGLPIRVLDKFFFAEKSTFSDAPLENCDVEGMQTIGFGLLVPPVLSNVNPVRIELSDIEDWVIEYGEEPKLWVKTVRAWYELRNPAVEYTSAFVSTRRKYELCVRISILGELMRASQLSYDEVIDLLSMTYQDMLAYKEKDILAEKRFILSQMEPLGMRSIMQSGFLRELRKRIRAEDRKSEAAADQEQPANEPDVQEAGSHPETENPNEQAEAQNIAQQRDMVPQAVSTVISSVLMEVTRSNRPIRKRKRSVSLSDSDSATGKARKEARLESADGPDASENISDAGCNSFNQMKPNDHSPEMNGHSAKRKTAPSSCSGVKREDVDADGSSSRTRQDGGGILKTSKSEDCNGHESNAGNSDEKTGAANGETVGKQKPIPLQGNSTTGEEIIMEGSTDVAKPQGARQQAPVSSKLTNSTIIGDHAHVGNKAKHVAKYEKSNGAQANGGLGDEGAQAAICKGEGE